MIVSLLPLEGSGAERRRLASLSFAFSQPLPFGHHPSMGRGDGLLIPLLPPSSGRRWRVAPEVGFALFRFQPTPALRASPPSMGRGDGLLIPLLPPSSGRRWRAAPEVGFALFRLRPTPCPSGITLPWEGERWATHPASLSFLWKEVARSAGGWLCSFSPSANPLPFGHPPSIGKG